MVLRASLRHGVGVVARQRFEHGDVVERVPLIIIPDEDLLYVATRTIEDGDEITFDYGDDTGF